MKLSIRLDLGDGPFTVTTNLFVIVNWERKFKAKASQLAEGMGYEDLAYMAFWCCKRDQIVVPSEFDKFVEIIKELDVVDTEQTNPTEAAPTDIS
jgi:hypothetical protein